MAKAPTSSPPGVIFEDPPADGRAFSVAGLVRSEWKLALIARPGEWARIPIAPNSTGVVRKRNPDFELLNRTVDGKPLVWARYVGKVS